MIFRQGDAVAAVMMIVQGFVKLLRTSPCGDETLVCIRSDGATINDAPTSAGELFHVSAEAVGLTSIMKLPAGRFTRLMWESPALAAAALDDAKRKVIELIREIESLKAPEMRMNGWRASFSPFAPRIRNNAGSGCHMISAWSRRN